MLNIRDCGGGSAGWVRAGEGSTAITHLTIEDSEIFIAGARTANPSKKFIRVRAGSVKFKRNKIWPRLAPPVDIMIETSIGGGACTLDLSDNTYPIGSNFSHGGVTYRGLAAWQAGVSSDSGSAYHAERVPEYIEDFVGEDAVLSAVPQWVQLSGGASDLQRKAGALYSANNTGTAGVYTIGDLSSDDAYVTYVNKNTASGGGAAIRHHLYRLHLGDRGGGSG